MFQLENSEAEREVCSGRNQVVGRQQRDIALVSSNWNGLEGACDDRAVTWDKSLPAPARIADSFQATRLVEEKKANNHSSITCLPMT